MLHLNDAENSRIPNSEFLKLEFPSLVSSPDLIGGSHHNKSRIPYRDPRVKPEDDIVWNSRIPNLELLEIASIALLPRNDTENSRIP